MPSKKSAVPNLRYLGCGGDDAPCRDGVLGCELHATTEAALARYRSCNIVIGDVRLDGAQIADLTNLAALRTVKGILWVTATSVRDLDPLSALDSVEHLLVESNPRLSDVSALDGIAFQGISVYDNDALRDLSGWRALRPIGDVDIGVTANAGLVTLGDWPWLRRATALQFSGDSLTSLGRFDNLTRVGVLGISALAKLTSSDGFPSLESVDQLVVTHATALTRLPAFPRLTSRVTRLQLIGNAFVDLRGLEHIPRADELTISENPELRSLDGLTALTSVAGRLVLDRNPKLRSVHGVSSLTNANELLVSMNPSLTSCEIEWLANRIGRPDDAHRFADNGGTGPCATP